MHVAFVINDISFNVFAANSEAVTGQQWNIWCQSSELVERSRAVGEIAAFIFNSVLSQQAHTLWPSTPPALKLWYSLSDIRRSQWWPVGIVSYIPSVSWFLRVIVQGKTPKTLEHCLKKHFWLHFFFLFRAGQTGNVTSWPFSCRLDRKSFTSKSELWQVVRRKIHRRGRRNRLPVAPKQ